MLISSNGVLDIKSTTTIGSRGLGLIAVFIEASGSGLSEAVDPDTHVLFMIFMTFVKM